MRLHIRHETRYTYEAPVSDSIQYIRLTPRNTPQQRIHAWPLEAPGAGSYTHLTLHTNDPVEISAQTRDVNKNTSTERTS